VIQKRWFRIETAKDGSILNCSEVEAKGRSGGVVRFYEAVDAADACSQAKAWYINDRNAKREWAAKARAAAKAKGLCVQCKRRKPFKGKKQCQVCSDMKREIHLRWREAGCPPLQRVSAADAMATKHEYNRQRNARTIDAQKVIDKLDELGGNGAELRAWLEAYISERLAA
jgi:hypothetical protein